MPFQTSTGLSSLPTSQIVFRSLQIPTHPVWCLIPSSFFYRHFWSVNWTLNTGAYTEPVLHNAGLEYSTVFTLHDVFEPAQTYLLYDGVSLRKSSPLLDDVVWDFLLPRHIRSRLEAMHLPEYKRSNFHSCPSGSIQHSLYTSFLWIQHI